MGIIKTGKIQSHGNFNALDDRITALEDTYVRHLWFAEISSGTSGTITPPTGGAIVLDQWAAGVDAVTSTLTTTRNPTFESVKDAAGTIITATLAANGAWTISGTPSAYPIAILYVYEVKLISADRTKCLVEIETDQGLKTTDSPTFAAVNATTFDTNVAAAGVTLAGTTLAADGTDANIDINLTPKGTGEVNITKVDIDGGTITGITDLVVADGGTGASNLTDHGILLGSGTDAVTPLGVGATGQLVKGVTGADPAWSTTVLTEATNAINLTNGTASIDIAAGKVVDINENLTVSGVTNIVGALDVASGKTVNIDDDVTVSAELHVEAATHVNQDLTSDAGPTFATATLSTAITDNTSTTQAATTAFAKSQDAVLAREPDQGVALTYAASGSSGITVADDDDIDMATNNFAPYFDGLVPDFTPAANLILIQKLTGGVGYQLEIVATTGIIRLTLNATAYNSSVAPTAVDGTRHKIVAVVTVGAVNTTVDFYFDGVALGTQQTAANPGTVSNAAPLYILGTSAVRTAGTVSSTGTLNFAPTAAEVLDMYRNGIPESWKWGSQTELLTPQVNRDFSGVSDWTNYDMATYDETGDMSITWNAAGQLCYLPITAIMVAGKRYRLSLDVANLTGTFKVTGNLAGQDFTGTVSTSGTGKYFEFIAVIPERLQVTSVSTSGGADLDNFSVVEIGATLALEPEGIQTDKWYDSSSNGLDATYPNAGWSLTRKMSEITATPAATGFTIAGGTTSKTLTVEDNSLINQDLTTDADPTFDTLTLTSGQLVFPATQVPSADANTLDDYEENTWTPSLTFGGAAVDMTYTTQSGVYTKVGRVVHASVRLILSAKGSSVGAATVSLPFAAAVQAVASLWLQNVTFANMLQATVEGTLQVLDLQQITEAGVVTGLTNTDFADTSRVLFSITYIV